MKRQRLRNRILLFLLPVLVVPLAVGGYISDQAAEEELMIQAQRQLASVSVGVELLTQFAAQRLCQDTAFVSSTPEMQNYLAYREFDMPREARATLEGLKRFMAEFARTAGDYLQVRYIDSRGDELVRVWDGRLMSAGRTPDSALFEEMKLAAGPYRSTDWGKVRLVGVRRLPGSNRLVLTAARPVHGAFQIKGQAGRYAVWGIVALDMDWKRVLDFFREMKSAEVVLFDRKGLVVAAPEDQDLLKPRPRELAIAEKLLSQKEEVSPDPFKWMGRWYQGRSAKITLPEKGQWTALVRVGMDIIKRPVQQVRIAIVVVTLVCTILAVAGIFYVSGIVTKPIQNLAEVIQRVAKGDLSTRVEEPGTREVAMLARSFNRMSEDLSRYIDELKRTTAEKERLASEMNIAAGLQMSVLPQSAPSLPGWDLAGFTVPARETGGDFFDYLELPSGNLGVVVADVSGKGLPAALFMLSARAYVRTLALSGLGPADVLSGANRLLAADAGQSGMFVTAFYAELDMFSGQVRYANAGHNPIIIVRCQGKKGVEELGRTGLPLGVMEQSPYQEQSAELAPGDLMALYTDGVTEAPDPENREWGVPRLIDELIRGCRLPAADLLGRVYQAVTDWSGGRPQFDDLTLLAVSRPDESGEGVCPSP